MSKPEFLFLLFTLIEYSLEKNIFPWRENIYVQNNLFKFRKGLDIRFLQTKQIPLPIPVRGGRQYTKGPEASMGLVFQQR